MDAFVLDSVDIREDMRQLRDTTPEVRYKVWQRFSRYHNWYYIPKTISIGRNFARDELDARYLDHMFNFVELTAHRNDKLGLHDLPLLYLRDSLLDRRWNQFSQCRDITDTIAFWVKFRIWISHDTCDLNLIRNSAALRDTHPHIFSEWNILRFPAGVPCPAPPAVYFFYDRIKKATGCEAVFWSQVVQHEYAYLFMSTWWHECERGQRAHILPQVSIDWLAERVGGKTYIDGETSNSNYGLTTSDFVIERMVDARYSSIELRHTIRYPKTNLPPSYFVISSRQTGVVMYNIPRPLLWVRSYQNGRLFVDIGTLSHLEDSRVHKFNPFTFSEQNIWNMVFPPSCRQVIEIHAPKELSDFLKTFVKTEGGLVKPGSCNLTDAELEPQRFGDYNDLSMFCLPLPKFSQQFRDLYYGVNNNNNGRSCPDFKMSETYGHYIEVPTSESRHYNNLFGNNSSGRFNSYDNSNSQQHPMNYRVRTDTPTINNNSNFGPPIPYRNNSNHRDNSTISNDRYNFNGRQHYDDDYINVRENRHNSNNFNTTFSRDCINNNPNNDHFNTDCYINDRSINFNNPNTSRNVRSNNPHYNYNTGSYSHRQERDVDHFHRRNNMNTSINIHNDSGRMYNNTNGRVNREPDPFTLPGNQADNGQAPRLDQHHSGAGPSNSNVPFSARELATQMATSVEYQRRSDHRSTPGVSQRFSGQRSMKNIKPLGFWDTDTFRHITIKMLNDKGNRNPSEGQIRGLMHELREMPAYKLQALFDAFQ